MKNMKKKNVILLILFLSVIGLVIYFLSNNKDTNILTFYGNVDIRQVDISFKVDGIIKDMIYEEGESVKKGDLLATLDDRDYLADYLRTEAESERLQHVSSNAQSTYSMNQGLCREGINSKLDCVNYLNSMNESAAAYKSALAAYKYAKNQLEYTKVYAPSDGFITTRIQEPGATVQKGQLIYTIIKDKPIWIRAYVPETNLGDIEYGTSVKVITDTVDKDTGKNREYIGRIGYISPVAEFTPKIVQTEDLRTDLVYRINVYVDQTDGFLKQGMPVTIKIDKRSKENPERAKLQR